MTMMLRALVLSVANMAKSLKHKASEHSILFQFFSPNCLVSQNFVFSRVMELADRNYQIHIFNQSLDNIHR